MRILIVGSGGREHALAWKLSNSPLVEKLFIAPGNGGTASLGENVDIKDDDLPRLTSFARDNEIDLVVIGPELPLVLGLSEALATANIPCFGPNAYAAQLEGSKAFAKTVMQRAGVPTADFKVFDDPEAAKIYLKHRDYPCVVKADGLAAGKGVVVAKEPAEALEAIDQMMIKQVFGAAGERVVIEDALIGEEASFLAFSDGEHIVCMPSSQDHKAIGEGDTGPNTGGMGAYSPAPILPPSDYEKTTELVIRPIIEDMAANGRPFVGVLYAGLMFTDEGPKVLEYNVRFGDPECQPLLSRLDTDLAEIMQACLDGKLDALDIRWKEETACCVVMAAEGYPGAYPKGMEITGLEEANALDTVTVFHAGTKAEDGKILSSGGRILGVTALGADLGEARKRAYEGVEKVHFDKSYFRHDIGDKGLRRQN
ncbi:phosphoribosylamine--glycine ligase [Desulfobaculum bizertense]|uniref:Phosphoribosylamine--glycine ligase n=1 Tax=Desulfobaculum bizertense DSM 18034 TaxID=1121442 RepID=A0A1T4WM23_9BACT|nr:phosphoribosylamine--glycine ligase [Desulfobaculum bizertense]UIJ37108.1 phosphoribosylamine--glycine ligase [Desulfobaculum bizertense]SKA77681.1 phosphoribosylamine--glycine ligase [Desulfobaculum bizertense DSM 18034]